MALPGAGVVDPPEDGGYEKPDASTPLDLMALPGAGVVDPPPDGGYEKPDASTPLDPMALPGAGLTQDSSDDGSSSEDDGGVCTGEDDGSGDGVCTGTSGTEPTEESAPETVTCYQDGGVAYCPEEVITITAPAPNEEPNSSSGSNGSMFDFPDESSDDMMSFPDANGGSGDSSSTWPDGWDSNGREAAEIRTGVTLMNPVGTHTEEYIKVVTDWITSTNDGSIGGALETTGKAVVGAPLVAAAAEWGMLHDTLDTLGDVADATGVTGAWNAVNDAVADMLDYPPPQTPTDPWSGDCQGDSPEELPVGCL
jgi:hypothetical protein